MTDAVESRGFMRRLFEAKSLEEMSAPTKIVVYAILAREWRGGSAGSDPRDTRY